MPKKKRTRTDREEVARKMLIETARAQAEHARRPGVEAKSFGDFLKQLAGQPSAEDVAVFNRGKDMHGAIKHSPPGYRGQKMYEAYVGSNPINQGPPTPQYMQNSGGPARDRLLQNAASGMNDMGIADIDAAKYQGAATGLLKPTQRKVHATLSRGYTGDPAYVLTDRHQGGEIQMRDAPSPADIDKLRRALEAAIATRNAALAGQMEHPSQLGRNAQIREQAREAYRKAMLPTR